MNKQVKKSLQFVAAMMVSLGLVFGLTPQIAMANVSEEPQQATKSIQMDTKVERITQELNKEGYNIQFGNGISDPGAGIYITSHTPGATYSCYAGKQIRVEANCYDLDDWQDYYAWFGIWDTTTEEYVDIQYTDYIVDSMESWYADLDTSGCEISSGRYEVDAVLWDDYMGWVEAIDSFYLTVKAMPAPSISSVVAVDPHSAKISWPASSGATGYLVYSATSSGGTYTKIGSTTATSYINTNMITGKSYYFKIKAYNNVGETTRYSGFSEYKVGIAKPLAPTPTVTSASYNSVIINWNPVTGANGYYIYKATTLNGTYTYAGYTSGTSKLMSSLTTGKYYYFKVRSYHTEGNGTKIFSNYSAGKSGKPLPATPTVTTKLASYNSVNISWNQIAGANGYEVLRYTAETGVYSKIITIINGSTTTYTNKALETGEKYYYKVRAYRVVDGVKVFGALAVGKSETTISTPEVQAFSNLDATIEVYWTECADSAGYRVYRLDSSIPDSGYVLIHDETDPSIFGYTDTNTESGVFYTYKVIAYQTETTGIVYGLYGISETVEAVK